MDDALINELRILLTFLESERLQLVDLTIRFPDGDVIVLLGEIRD